MQDRCVRSLVARSCDVSGLSIEEEKLCFREVAPRCSLALWANLCVAQPQAPAPKSLDDLDGIVTKAMADSKIPGISVAIVRDGKVIYAKGFGYRDVEKRVQGSPRKSLSKCVISDRRLTFGDKQVRKIEFV
jgi:Beta-lactamase